MPGCISVVLLNFPSISVFLRSSTATVALLPCDFAIRIYFACPCVPVLVFLISWRFRTQPGFNFSGELPGVLFDSLFCQRPKVWAMRRLPLYSRFAHFYVSVSSRLRQKLLHCWFRFSIFCVNNISKITLQLVFVSFLFF